jgi:cellulose synthase/poly-beta-1,6-N-acetylglucosamine synthase-like glycosyltransferase
MEWLLYISIAMLAYIFVIYPLLLLVMASLFATRRAPRKQQALPGVSVVIAAHNEIHNIEKRLRDLLKQDYPLGSLQIIVGSDGSSDGTVRAIEAIREEIEQRGPKLTVLDFPERRGKPSVLNDAVEFADHDILVMTDARQTFAKDAIRHLVSNFSDPLVGAVSGELFLVDASEDDHVSGAGRYWSYEKWIRKTESSVHSTVGATGAIYALRKALFIPINAKTLIDDVVIPMQVCLQGYRVAFDARAHAFDVAPSESGQEWVRKVRTLAGNWQLFALYPAFFNPLRNPIFFQFMSHKISRLMLPFALMGIFIASANLNGIIFQLLFWAQIGCYATGLAAFIKPSLRQVRLPAVIYFFCILNAAILVGLMRLLKGEQAALWQFAYKRK